MSEAKRIVLVTGGAKGIGRAVVEAFAPDSEVIINCFHSYDQGRQLEKELRARGSHVRCIRASVENEKQREALFAEVKADHGGIDVLINNAAFGRFQSVSDAGSVEMRRAYEVNVVAALECARLAHPLLRSRGGGSIVNLTSVGSQLVVANYVGVGTSKAALESLTRYLAADWAADGIRVNGVSGGLIDGDVADRFPDATEMQKVAREATPFQRLGKASEIANAVRFLASDEASWITGQTIVADGGLSLGGAMLAAPRDWFARTHSPTDSNASGEPAAQRPASPAPSEYRPVKQESVARSSIAPNTALTDLGTPETRGDEQPDDAAPAPPRHDKSVDSPDAIAIVGMGVVTPGASTPDEFWNVLRDGPELLSSNNPARIRPEYFSSDDRAEEDKTYQIASGYADRYTPHPRLQEELGDDRRATDFATQWLRHAVLSAIDGRDLGERVGCAIGYTADGNQHLEESIVVESFVSDVTDILRENGGSLSASQGTELRASLDRAYGLHRASAGAAPLPIDVGLDAVRDLLPDTSDVLMVDTACSSSLYALDIAAKGLREGRYDSAVCGGTFTVGPRNAVLFAKLHGLSQSGNLRPLDEQCDGVLFSDGAAVLLLKRHADAIRDGDEILGFISSIGMSSDGKGKAIYAPSTRGQQLAIERAYASSGPGQGVDWIVAHATGTPAGDLCEITSIRSKAPAHARTYLTSNKSLIGHTGWAAGVVSVIQVLLSLREQTILPQHRFTRAPESYELDGSAFEIPIESKPWPARTEPRRAAVSGFGFGGTNAHLVVSDRPGRDEATHDDDPAVIVGWGADLPGLGDVDEIAEWARSGDEPLSCSFGETYDVTGLALRVPPRVLRTIDRTQLIAVRAAQSLRQQLSAVWEAERERIGVFVGHMGPTRNAMMYARRSHIDLVLAALREGTIGIGFTKGHEDELRRRVAAAVLPSNEDSFPGIMPNIISARISNVFDTNGPNMGIDVGEASALGAIDVAARYVRAGDVSVAIAGGVHGNSHELLGRLGEGTWGPRTYAEGGVLFAVTRRSFARANGLPILATLGEAKRTRTRATVPNLSFGGAQAAFALLRGLLKEQDGEVVAAIRPGLEFSLGVTTGGCDSDAPEDSVKVDTHQPTASDTPSVTSDAAPLPQELQTDIRRFDRSWVRTAPWTPATYQRTASTTYLNGDSLTALLTGGAASASDTVQGTENPHVRLVIDMTNVARLPSTDSADWRRVGAWHDGLLRYLQTRTQPPSSIAIAIVGGWHDGTVHPLAGLFTGFVKSLSLEYASAAVSCVLLESDGEDHALAAAEDALSQPESLPTAAYSAGFRYSERILPASEQTDPSRGLDGRSVVVATGGARGVTSEIVRFIARTFGSEIHLIGSSDLAGNLAVAASTPAIALHDRASFIRYRRDSGAKTSVAEIVKEFDAITGAIQTRELIAELEAHSGRGRATYHRADVRDAAKLRAVARQIERGGKVDLVIHGAGINRAATVATKNPSAYADVREIKIGGYLNLKAAFAESPRRWCSFGSLIGLTGQYGETDYAGANDVLSAFALAKTAAGEDEFCIGWTLWRDIGMGSSDVHRSFFSETRGGMLTQMPTSDGVELFRRELLRPAGAASVVHIGSVEAGAIGRLAKGLMPEQREISNGFYIDRVEREGETVTAFRMIDHRDINLEHHSVAGIGTLPGCFVVELAAEAARVLHPGLRITGLRDLEFHAFVRLDGPATRSPLRIRATTRERTASGTIAVDVVVDSEVRSPRGVLLQESKLYYTARVIMSDEPPRAPIHQPWPDAPEIPIFDPYHVPGARIFLDKEFKTTVETRLHPLGKRARYEVDLPSDGPYQQFHTPVLLLDGLVRLAVLEPLEGRYLPVAAPTRIAHLDLWTDLNDTGLSGRDIALYSSPRGIGIDTAVEDRYWAVDADGRYLVQMRGVEGVVLGYVDERTGETRTDLDALKPRRAPAVAL
ncbi:SDR family oxidoreductase [Microbacterium lacticum]|uniref:SDR family oxidoreductase n=1 Tax=Microbacterium lacticum TaxID=33885 RepID=UPI0018B09F4E|nr:SDR family oxidoreductase [Microbacterium lacticum]MBF9337043.1 SDR family oxidoreductase [Microbacterium lacticum]